jgi:DNA polymerase-3 subunit delta
MRLTRLSASDLRGDPAALSDAIKAQGFFPGPRVAFVEDATDTIAATVAAALDDWQEGDAQVIVTAGALRATSKLRKYFEAHRNAYATGIYDDPPSRGEVEALLAKAGLTDVAPAAMTDLLALSRALDPGDFRQTLEKLSLYKLGDDSAVSPGDIADCAPATVEAAVDDVLNVVAEAQIGDIGPMMTRLRAQGVAPVTVCIGATRHFRGLYTAASDPGGPASGIGRMRPPVYGPRRDRMVRQAGSWGAFKLEQALEMLNDTDLKLRSAAQHAPAMALVERTLIRLAMLGKSG